MKTLKGISVAILAGLIVITFGVRRLDAALVTEHGSNNKAASSRFTPKTGSFKYMTQDNSTTKNLSVTRSFDAPVEKVWKQWSESENVMRWWGPTGFTSPLAKMDFREGGVSLVCMRAPKEFGGFDMYNTWSYKKIVPHERIEFVLNFSDKDGNKLDPAKMGLPPGIPQDVPHAITFKSLGANKTEMTVNEYGYTTDTAVQTSKAGLDQCLDKMAENLK